MTKQVVRQRIMVGNPQDRRSLVPVDAIIPIGQVKNNEVVFYLTWLSLGYPTIPADVPVGIPEDAWERAQMRDQVGL